MKKIHFWFMLTAVVAVSLLSTATAVTASEWNVTLQATSGLENVKYGIDSTATNDFDAGTDAAATIPGAPTQPWTQIALLTPTGASMQTWINSDNMTWLLKVTINKLATSTVSWSTSDIPSYLDITINNTDMRSASSLDLTGDAGGSTVYYLPINASYKTWNVTLQATNGLENVKYGIDSAATNDFDAGTDATATMPGAPTQSWTQIALLTPTGASMQTWINSDNMTWLLKVTINKLATSTVSWSTSDIPSYLDITINNTDMRSASSLDLTGDAGGSTVYYLPINASPSTGPPAPTITTYTISNTTINPSESETTSIDVRFSERVSAIIKIEDTSGNLVNELYNDDVTNPDPQIWDGTNTTGAQVPDGIYTVNVTGTNTTTGLSVIDTSKMITVSTVGVLTTITVSPSTAYVNPTGTEQFTATAEDQYGNTMSGIVFTWSSSNTTVGTISTTGLFTATSTLGTTTIKAANGTVNGTASVTVAYVRDVILDFNANNHGYNYIAWSGGDSSASTLAGLINNEEAFGDSEWIAQYNTTSGTWAFYFGDGRGSDFELTKYDPVCVRIKADATYSLTFQMPI